MAIFLFTVFFLHIPQYMCVSVLIIGSLNLGLRDGKGWIELLSEYCFLQLLYSTVSCSGFPPKSRKMVVGFKLESIK